MDSYIESALISLSAAWANDQMYVACNPLSDALAHIAGAITSIRQDSQVQREAIETLRVSHIALRDDMVDVKTRLFEIEARLNTLTTDTHGFVQRPELFEKLNAQRNEVQCQIRADVEIVQASVERLSGRVHEVSLNHEAVFGKTEVSVRKLSLELEKALDVNADYERNTKQALVQQQQQHYALAKSVDESRTALHTDIVDLRKQCEERFEKQQEDLSRYLETAVDQLFGHMKSQGESVDALKRRDNERQIAMPNKDEIRSLSNDMIAARTDLHDAQLSLSETVAKCMTLMATSSSLGGGGGSGFGGNGGSAPSILDMTSVSRSGISPAVQSLLGTGISASIDIQLDLLRKEIVHVKEVVVPSCQTEIRGVDTACREGLEAVGRAEKLMATLCQALGMGDGDEVRAALEASDFHKVVHLLRRGLAVLQQDRYKLPSLKGMASMVGSKVGGISTTTAATTGAGSSEMASGGDGDAPDSPNSAGRKRTVSFGGTAGSSALGRGGPKRDSVTDPMDAFDDGTPQRGGGVPVVPSAWRSSKGGDAGGGASSQDSPNGRHGVSVGSDVALDADDLEETDADGSPRSVTGSTAQLPFSLDGSRPRRRRLPSTATIVPPCPPPTLGMDIADAIGGYLGVQVMHVVPGGTADTFGVRTGDRVIKVNGDRCDNCRDFIKQVQTATRMARVRFHSRGGARSDSPERPSPAAAAAAAAQEGANVRNDAVVVLEFCVIASRDAKTTYLTLCVPLPGV